MRIILSTKLFVALLVWPFFFSCRTDGVAMAKEICECVNEANDMARGTTSRFDKFNDCWDLMDAYELKLEETPEEKLKFDNTFPCTDTIRL